LKDGRISRLVIGYAMACGGLLALLVALVCSVWDYRDDQQRMDATLSSVGAVLSSELDGGLLHDRTRCETLLRAMADLHRLAMITVQGTNADGSFTVSVGDHQVHEMIVKKFPLILTGEAGFSAVLSLAADPEQLLQTALKKGLQAFLLMLLFSGALSGCLWLFMNYGLVRPLHRVIRYTEGLGADDPDPPGGDGKVFGPAEIDLLAGAVQALNQRLTQKLIAGRETEGLLTALLNSTPDLIFYKDNQSVYRGCNAAFAEFSGRKMHELAGLTDFDLFPAGQAALSDDQDKKLFAAGDPESSEEWVRYPDGRAVFLQTLKTAYRDENGAVLGLIGISRDVTCRKAMDNELEAARRRFEEACNACPVMVLTLGCEAGRFIDVNQCFLHKTGYGKQEFLEGKAADIGFWGSAEDQENIMAELAGKGRIEGFPVRIRTKSGQEVSCLLSGRKMLSSAGECLLLFLEDLSRGELVEKALQVSESRFRDFANSAADWFWEMDRDFCFTYLTGKVEETMGKRTEDLVGRPWTQAFSGREGSAGWKMIFDRMLRQEAFSEVEIEWLQPEGNVRWIALDGRPVADSDGRFSGYRGVGRDITRRKEAEEAVQRSIKIDAAGHAMGGIAHDFNNILGIIIGNLDFIKRFGQVDETSRNRLEAVTKASERGSMLTRQLLDFSRHQARDCQPTDINGILQGMDNLIARTVTPEVEVTTDLAAALWTTDIDGGDFEDVVLNLVINARDAMTKGGRLHISTSNTTLDEYYTLMNPGITPGEYILLAVSDTGGGIPSEVLEHIFEPFYTTKPRGKGTGLGLSMVYAFTQRSMGGIKVYSEPGTGTSIHLYLPKSTQELPRLPGNPAGIPGLPSGDETILVVDDETDLLALTADMLQALGYTTLTAENGKEAMALLLEKGTAIDLLYTDVVMPGGMNGFELAEQALLVNPDLKVLFTSGYFEKATPMAGQFAFSPQIVFKPCFERELAVRIHDTLHG
jgi:PAS domain S-box-containing protein